MPIPSISQEKREKNPFLLTDKQKVGSFEQTETDKINPFSLVNPKLEDES